jgi:hypothetical protein
MASCGNCLPTFWDNISVPSSRVRKSRKKRRQAITQLNRGRCGVVTVISKHDVITLIISHCPTPSPIWLCYGLPAFFSSWTSCPLKMRPNDTTQYPRRMQISSTSWQNTAIKDTCTVFDIQQFWDWQSNKKVIIKSIVSKVIWASAFWGISQILFSFYVYFSVYFTYISSSSLSV